MRCIEQIKEEFQRIEEIASTAISCFKIIKDSCESHSKLISSKHDELIKKAEKLPLSHIEKTILQILSNEKEKCEIKASFLKVNCLPSLEDILERNRLDLKVFRDKGNELLVEDNKLAEQIEKIKKKQTISLTDYCKIQSLFKRRNEVYQSKENEFDEYFRKVVSSINTNLKNITKETHRFISFTQQMKDRGIDQFKLILDTNEDSNLSLGLFKSIAFEELNSNKEIELKLISNQKVKIKEFLAGWKDGTLFLFPNAVILALCNSKCRDIQQITDLRYETNIFEFNIQIIKIHRLKENKLRIENKRKGILDSIFDFNSLEMKFENERELENFVKEMPVENN